jgi:3-(3-hydroxy-phenyl)propionate hydroxylase
VWQHLMADDVWRLDYQMAPGCDMQEVSRLGVVLERLQRQFAGKLNVKTDCEVVWVGPYAYKGEHLDQLRHGRVFFVGDSAHVVSPFGARGGNSGVQDADNLAWKLAAVQLGHAGESLLDAYQTERHAAAVQNVQVTNRTARFLRPADGVERQFRDAALHLAKRHAHLRPYVNTGRMSSPNLYPASPALALPNGTAVQNAALHWANGSPGELVDLVQWAGARLLLLWFGPLNKRDASALRNLGKALPLRSVQVCAAGGETAGAHVSAHESVHETSAAAALRSACGLATHAVGWALLRPDLYLAATGQTAHQIASAVARVTATERADQKKARP